MPKHSFLSGRAFDAGLAALAALSAGFVAFTMPDPLFAGLVEASRLSEIVAAARPPLGDTARFAAVTAAIVGTFASVWALMTLLGRAPARSKAEPQPVVQAPRQRRADAHPDAPPRPPLLARDLGEPLELDELAPEPVEEKPFAEADPRPLPAFLVAQEPEPIAVADPVEAELEPQPQPQPQPEPEPEPAAEAQPEPEPEPEPKAETVTVAETVPEAETVPIAELAARLREAEDEDGNDKESNASLSQLVNRIEFGMSRKRQALPAVDLPPVEPPSADQEKVGHRLRSAISDLQKIASSGA